MNTDITKDYRTARDGCWKEYREDNPDMSEYMERDYKDGFHDGWHAAMKAVEERNTEKYRHERELRERAAIAAMQGMLASGTAESNRAALAKIAVRSADSLIYELNRK